MHFFPSPCFASVQRSKERTGQNREPLTAYLRKRQRSVRGPYQAYLRIYRLFLIKECTRLLLNRGRRKGEGNT